MRRGTCVKCGATTVRAAVNGIQLGDQAYTALRPHLEPGFRGAVRRQQADLWAYACTTCGYVELHLLDAAALQYVGQHWLPVPVATEQP
jgi:hypothetical protein